MLNPELPKIISYAKLMPGFMKPDSSILVNTSLNNLPDPATLLKSGVNSISISLSGMTQEVYSMNHKGGNIETVISNILELVRIKRIEKLEKVTLCMTFHDYIYNNKESKLAKEFCEKHGLYFNFKRTYVCCVEDAVNLQKNKEDMSKFYSKFIDLKKEVSLMRTIEYSDIMNCQHRKKRITVNFDGQLCRCCGVFEKKHFMGSIFDFKIKNIPRIESEICKICAKTPISWR